MTIRTLTLLTAAVLVLGACDSGPSGPGSITAYATAPSLGGVVLEVQGAGVRGFTARGSSRVYSAAVAGRTPPTHRVIVITPESGEMAVDIAVDDLGMEGPTVRVVSASNDANQAIAARDVTVRLER